MITFISAGFTLSQMAAKLRDREISTATPERSVNWPDGGLMPSMGAAKYRWKKIKLVIEFKSGGNDQFTIEYNRGEIQNALDGKYIKFNDIVGYRFYVVLDGEPAISDNIHRKYQSVTYNLLGYMESETEMTAEEFNGKMSPNNTNTATPATITMSGADTITVTLGDDTFTVTGIGAGTVTIGNGKVLKNGVNHWGNVTMKRFPRLNPGFNNFTKTPVGAVVTVKYRGRLI